jgi:hypothetical protein
MNLPVTYRQLYELRVTEYHGRATCVSVSYSGVHVIKHREGTSSDVTTSLLLTLSNSSFTNFPISQRCMFCVTGRIHQHSEL